MPALPRVRYVLAVGLIAAASGVGAKAHPLRVSAYRRYFWGARQAYERRDFKLARRDLRTYESLGSPSDKLVQQAGCDIPAEVHEFSAMLREALHCITHRGQSAHWSAQKADEAKLFILETLARGSVAALQPYIDCAPVDLTAPSNACREAPPPSAADLEKLSAALRAQPDILKQPNWRKFPLSADDPQRIRWILFTYSNHWKPCAAEAAPIVSLREDTNGELRIAGFAASCVGSAETPIN